MHRASHIFRRWSDRWTDGSNATVGGGAVWSPILFPSCPHYESWCMRPLLQECPYHFFFFFFFLVLSKLLIPLLADGKLVLNNSHSVVDFLPTRTTFLFKINWTQYMWRYVTQWLARQAYNQERSAGIRITTVSQSHAFTSLHVFAARVGKKM